MRRVQPAQRVASRCGAVAVGRTYLLPPLSFGGASPARPWLRFPIPLIGRVEDWRAGLGRCRATSPAPSTSNVACGFPAYAPPFASRRGLWDLSCRGDFRPVASPSIAVEKPQLV